MQETLTKLDLYNFYKIKNKKNIKPVFLLVVITILVLIIISIICMFINYKNDTNKKEKYYLLSLNQSASKKTIETLKDVAEETIDVSYVYEQEGIYHVIGFVYSSLTEAQKKLEQSKKLFNKAQIILLNKNKLKKSVFNKIKQEPTLFSVYNYMCSLNNKALTLCKEAKNGKGFSFIYRELSKIEINILNSYEKLFDLESNKIVDSLKLTCSVMLSYVKSCQNEVVVGSDLLENNKKLYFNIFFELLELNKSLQKL